MSGKRVVIKVGSSTVTSSEGGLDRDMVKSLVGQLCDLREAGHSPILVSSGAIAAGLDRLGMTERPTDMPSLQAAASVGQVSLIEVYSVYFAERRVPVGQVLLTRHDTGHRESFLHARDTMERLLELGVVPVVNENDTVAVDEIRFGDNDTLAALVAAMVSADLVVLLSDIEGFYDSDPRTSDEAVLLSEVDELTEDVLAAAGAAGSEVGSGGMVTKLEAARALMRAGIPMMLCDGRKPGVVGEAVAGAPVGTCFKPGEDTLGAMKLWIALGRRPAGEIVVDDGAAAAILDRGSSLLPAGVVGVNGVFSAGDAVVLMDCSGAVLGRGLSELASADIERVKGMKTSQIAEKFPSLEGKEVVHRDRLAIL